MKRSLFNSLWPVEWYVALVCLAGVFCAGRFLADGDTGVHIRAGQYMLEHRTFIRQDLFSYFTPAVPWHNHEWLAQGIMAWLFGFSGLKGVVFFYYFLAAGILCLLFQQMKHKSSTVPALFLFIFVFINLSSHFLARPHLFTMFFTVLWKKILDDFQEGRKNRLFLLPFFMLFWVNLHGGFVIGMLLLGIYGAGNFIPSFWGDAKPKKKNLDRTRALVVTVLACFLVTLFNPDGIYIWKYIFGFTSNPLLMNRIAEFKSTDFHRFSPLLHFVYLAFIVIAAARTPLTLIEWILAAVFASMALYSARHLPLFTIVTAPIVSAKLSGIWSGMESRIPSFSLRKRGPLPSKCFFGFNVFFIGVLLAGGAYAVSPLKTVAYDPQSKPVRAVEFLQKENLPGRIFSSDEDGDYLIYKLWPDTKVFIYGWFNDTGAMERFRDYLEMAYVRPRWQQVFDKHQINLILSATEAPLTSALVSHPEWKLIYSDPVSSLFIRVLPSNQPWIDRFSGVSLSEIKPLS